MHIYHITQSEPEIIITNSTFASFRAPRSLRYLSWVALNSQGIIVL